MSMSMFPSMMKYEHSWLILFLPLLAAVITLFTLKYRNVSALLSIGAIVIGFVSTVAFIAANGWVSALSPPSTGFPSAT